MGRSKKPYISGQGDINFLFLKRGPWGFFVIPLEGPDLEGTEKYKTKYTTQKNKITHRQNINYKI